MQANNVIKFTLTAVKLIHYQLFYGDDIIFILSVYETVSLSKESAVKPSGLPFDYNYKSGMCRHGDVVSYLISHPFPLAYLLNDNWNLYLNISHQTLGQLIFRGSECQHTSTYLLETPHYSMTVLKTG